MKNIFHIHIWKPILSRYISFSSRDIIYECKCGKKKEKRVWKNFSDPFPIETAMLLSYKEYQEVLNK